MAVWSWGAGTQGQLGLGTTIDALVPQRMDQPLQIRSMACGGAHAVAILDGGGVATWGRGLIGHDEEDDQNVVIVPKVVEFFIGYNVCEVSAGWNHTAFVTDSGELFTCGDGSFGQLGHGDFVSRGTPCKVVALSTCFKVACGMRHTLVLTGHGDCRVVKAFGLAKRGQLGSLSSKELNKVSSPQAVPSLDLCDIVALAANGDHSAALSSSGKLFLWGRTYDGEADASVPFLVSEQMKFCQVSLGWNHGLGLTEDGEVLSWGSNRYGQLGSIQRIDDQSSIKLFKVEFGEHRIVCVGAGSEHSAAVDGVGNVYTWGWGEHGQLGLGHTEDRSRPCIVERVMGFRV